MKKIERTGARGGPHRRFALWVLAALPLLTAPNCKPPIIPPAPPPPAPDAREACTSSTLLRQPFFGDLHVHTTRSLDADLQGTRTTPDEAYEFAKGKISVQPYGEGGVTVPKLAPGRELDFAMVSDHAEFFGEVSICRTPGLPGYDSPRCQGYRNDPLASLWFNSLLSEKAPSRLEEICGEDGQHCADASLTVWNEMQDAAERAYDRTSTCEFTSFVGYEWTGSTKQKNLHRNVVFKNVYVPTQPTSYFEAPHAELLWDALENDCEANAPGCEFLTIPHNSNLSQGEYFLPKDIDGNSYYYDEALVMRRQRMEPLVEVIQHKGQSECLPSSEDELCGFEVVPYNNLTGAAFDQRRAPNPKDFVRSALKVGLNFQRFMGANPFKYGMVGGTDTHLGISGAVSEENYPGHGGAASVATDGTPAGLSAIDNPTFNPGGLTVAWAEENSRESLFSAMQRREVYATSGTRPIVRFFASRGYPRWTPSMCNLDHDERIDKAYDEGVPMGGNIGPDQHPWAMYGVLDSPSFLVQVAKDPEGANLQQVQIVKISVPGLPGGEAQETVYEVAGDSSNGASVDLDTCDPVGPGFSELCTVWQDPAYSPFDPALYYVRVIENPTCRWTKRQCNAGGVDCDNPATVTAGFEACCDPLVPTKIQERAWTSPIWYDLASSSEPPPTFTLEASNDEFALCAGGASEAMAIDVGQLGGFENPVTLTTEFLRAGVDVTFSSNPVTPPGQSIAQIQASSSALYQGRTFFLIKGSTVGAPDQMLLGILDVFDAEPGAPWLLSPADGAVDVAPNPVLFTWVAGAQTQGDLFELSEDEEFTNVVESGISESGIFALSEELESNKTYYWRAAGQNVCGPGATSTTFSFTTGSAP